MYIDNALFSAFPQSVRAYIAERVALIERAKANGQRVVHRRLPTTPSFDKEDHYHLEFTACHLRAEADRLEAEQQQQAAADEELIDHMVEAYFTAAHCNVPKTVYPHVRKGMRAAANLLRDGGEK